MSDILTVGRKLELGLSGFRDGSFGAAFNHFTAIAQSLFPNQSMGLLLTDYPQAGGSPKGSMVLMEKIAGKVNLRNLHHAIGEAYAYGLEEGMGPGKEVEKDIAKAKIWLTKSAEAGHADSQKLLGDLYRIDDQSMAYKWYILNGSPEALEEASALKLSPGRTTMIEQALVDWLPKEPRVPGAIDLSRQLDFIPAQGKWRLLPE